jgi:tRNA threonylcarbamoyladenosine biosynthesis protein TsaE
MNIEVDSGSEARTTTLAATLAGCLQGGDVVALDGPLGAGKTCFVRGLAAGLGIDANQVSSPTFVLMHEYEGGRLPLVHVDAYRLEDADELAGIGWAELMADNEAIVAIEWASRVAGALPARRITVHLTHIGPENRLVAIKAAPDMEDRLADFPKDLCDQSPPRCPVCNGQPPQDGEAFPFCSPRCRLVDLGNWMDGGYRISRSLGEADEE